MNNLHLITVVDVEELIHLVYERYRIILDEIPSYLRFKNARELLIKPVYEKSGDIYTIIGYRAVIDTVDGYICLESRLLDINKLVFYRYEIKPLYSIGR